MNRLTIFNTVLATSLLCSTAITNTALANNPWEVQASSNQPIGLYSKPDVQAKGNFQDKLNNALKTQQKRRVIQRQNTSSRLSNIEPAAGRDQMVRTDMWGNPIKRNIPKLPRTTDPSLNANSISNSLKTGDVRMQPNRVWGRNTMPKPVEPGVKTWSKAKQVKISPQVKSQLNWAGTKGQIQLLEAVREAVALYPEMADAIVAQATSISTGAGMATGMPQAILSTASLTSSAATTLGLSAMGVAAAGATAFAATAAFSSGGSEGRSESGISFTDIGPNAQGGDPAFTSDTEFKASDSLEQINADKIYTRTTGFGVKVAVLDTGIDGDHPDLVDRVITGGFDYVEGTAGVTLDGDGHGTHVTGTIAATRNGFGIQGVAYSSSILPYRVFDDAGDSVDDDSYGQAFDAAIFQGAQVFNNSWGISSSVLDMTGATYRALYPETTRGIEDAVASGAAVVFAAGNDGNAQVSIDSGLPLYFPALEELYVSVVAVDESNAIASFSNQCGVALNWCIAAPGVDVKSTIPYDASDESLDPEEDGFGLLSGTSMAAPHVAGAIALLLETNLGLTAEEAIDIIFTTATDIGDAGDDAVFGQGLLNLEAAMGTLGTTSIPLGTTVSGTAIDVDSSSLRSSTAFGSSMQKSLSGTNLIALDSYNRAFTTSLSSFVGEKGDSFNSEEAFFNFNSEEDRKLQIGKKTTLSFTSNQNSDNDPIDDPSEELDDGEMRSLSFNTEYQNNNIGVNYNRSAGNEFSLYSDADDFSDKDLIIDTSFSNSYLNLVSEQDNIGITNQIKVRGGNLKIGNFYGKSSENDDTNSNATIAEYQFDINDKTQAAIQAGFVFEENGVLGSYGDGAFAFGNGTTTFSGVNFERELGKDAKLIGSYQLGMSKMDGDSKSLIGDYKDVKSDSFSLGVIKDKILNKQDKIGLSISQPLRVSSGTGSITTPNARDAEGNIISSEQKLSLAPAGREINMQAWYSNKINDKTDFKFGMAYRHEPGHIKEEDDDFVGMFNIKRKF